VFGVHSLAKHPDPSEWKVAEDSGGAKLWSALRSQPESKYLGMTIPRFIARLPYGSDNDTLETFEFEEFESLSEHDNYSWTNGCFAAAMLLAKSFSKYGWQFGRQIIQDIEGLPIHVYKDAGETVYKSCAEIPMTDIGVGKLMDMGFIPLV